MLGALGSESWAKQGKGDNQWKGSLNYITSPDYYEYFDYIDMQKIYCDMDTTEYEYDSDLADALCKTFKNMRGAGAAFNFFEVFAYVATVLWMIRVLYSLLEKKFLSNCWGYVWPSLGLFFHILAEIIWSGATGAKMSGSCDKLNSGSDPEDICATQGPAVVLVVTLLYIITATIFYIVYNKRRGTKEEELETDNIHAGGGSLNNNGV
mmetsp:Transcript_32440/g.32141  ORF Transcript_32440/g.32141 Transcript_32440/m.32141 type:complete len:208 (+) Transcript_32440:131-754(+)